MLYVRQSGSGFERLIRLLYMILLSKFLVFWIIPPCLHEGLWLVFIQKIHQKTKVFCLFLKQLFHCVHCSLGVIATQKCI